MRLRILRGTCLGHFSGVHAWNIQTQTQIASLAAAFGAGQAASAASPAAISGSAEPGLEELLWFSQKQLVQTVHSLEKAYRIDRDDRAMRLITPGADTAIQGPSTVLV